MSEKNRAVGYNTDNGVVVTSNNHIPNLDQWVRDYVDKRSVNDGLFVLQATVEDGEVEHLAINGRCATNLAEKYSEKDGSSLDVTYNL